MSISKILANKEKTQEDFQKYGGRGQRHSNNIERKIKKIAHENTAHEGKKSHAKW